MHPHDLVFLIFRGDLLVGQLSAQTQLAAFQKDAQRRKSRHIGRLMKTENRHAKSARQHFWQIIHGDCFNILVCGGASAKQDRRLGLTLHRLGAKEPFKGVEGVRQDRHRAVAEQAAAGEPLAAQLRDREHRTIEPFDGAIAGEIIDLGRRQAAIELLQIVNHDPAAPGEEIGHRHGIVGIEREIGPQYQPDQRQHGLLDQNRDHVEQISRQLAANARCADEADAKSFLA